MSIQLTKQIMKRKQYTLSFKNMLKNQIKSDFVKILIIYISLQNMKKKYV